MSVCGDDCDRVVFGGHVSVTKFRGVALNGLFCADVLWPLNLVPSLTLPTNTTAIVMVMRIAVMVCRSGWQLNSW